MYHGTECTTMEQIVSQKACNQKYRPRDERWMQTFGWGIPRSTQGCGRLSSLITVFIHIIGKGLLGTGLEKDYENTSCMFTAIPLRCEVQHKGNQLTNRFFESKDLGKNVFISVLDKKCYI